MAPRDVSEDIFTFQKATTYLKSWKSISREESSQMRRKSIENQQDGPQDASSRIWPIERSFIPNYPSSLDFSSGESVCMHVCTYRYTRTRVGPLLLFLFYLFFLSLLDIRSSTYFRIALRILSRLRAPSLFFLNSIIIYDSWTALADLTILARCVNNRRKREN